MIRTHGDNAAIKCPHCGYHNHNVITDESGASIVEANITTRTAFRRNCQNKKCGKEIIFVASWSIILIAYSELTPELKAEHGRQANSHLGGAGLTGET